LKIRQEVWDVAKSLSNEEELASPLEGPGGSTSGISGDSILFGRFQLQFATARHLALSAYVTTCWSVYDCISNVCGRLIGHENIGSNLLATANPKLVEHFIRENKEKYKQHGFSLWPVLASAYAWPIRLSYAIRNWIMHEGLYADGTPLFKGNTLLDSFEISTGAMKKLKDICSEDNIDQSQCCYAGDPDHPWYDKQLLTILKKCNEETDEALCCLLTWGVTSFVEQVKMFAKRDGRNTVSP